MNWNLFPEKVPRFNKLIMVICQGKLYITKREKNPWDDIDYGYSEIRGYEIGKKFFKESYLKQMSDFGSPIIEYWTYFPTKGLPNKFHINRYDGDKVVSNETVQAPQTNGTEWEERCLKEQKFCHQEKDRESVWFAIKEMWKR